MICAGVQGTRAHGCQLAARLLPTQQPLAACLFHTGADGVAQTGYQVLPKKCKNDKNIAVSLLTVLHILTSCSTFSHLPTGTPLIVLRLVSTPSAVSRGDCAGLEAKTKSTLPFRATASFTKCAPSARKTALGSADRA